jgi:hypothetical protein
VVNRVCVKTGAKCKTVLPQNPYLCATCITGFAYNGNCVDICPFGTYQDNGICSNCMSNCQKCTNGTTCEVSFSGFYVSLTGNIVT